MPKTIRVIIADDHPIMREGLKQLFAVAGNVDVVDEATNGTELSAKLPRHDIDLLLLDMTMPGLSGEDLVAHLRSNNPSLPILVLSMHNEAQIAQRALKAGASGYLAKDRDPETLLAAIRRVAAGDRFIDPVLAEQMAFESSGHGRLARHQSLSEREFQVLRLFARGLTVKEIARKLSISNKTVSTHKARLMEKMSFTSNTELIRYALVHQLTG